MRVRVSPYAPIWSHRLAVRTSPFHGDDTGSIPVGTTKFWDNGTVGLARSPDKTEVEGSSPSCPTNTLLLKNSRLYYIHIWAVSILGIMLRLHRREGSSILPRSTNF